MQEQFSISQKHDNHKDDNKRRYTWSCGDNKSQKAYYNNCQHLMEQNFNATNALANNEQGIKEIEKNRKGLQFIEEQIQKGQLKNRKNSIYKNTIIQRQNSQEESIKTQRLNELKKQNVRRNQAIEVEVFVLKQIKQLKLKIFNLKEDHKNHLCLQKYMTERIYLKQQQRQKWQMQLESLKHKYKQMKGQQQQLYKQASYFYEIKKQKYEIKMGEKQKRRNQEEIERINFLMHGLKGKHSIYVQQKLYQIFKQKQKNLQLSQKLSTLQHSIGEWNDKMFHVKQTYFRMQRIIKDKKIQIQKLKQLIKKQAQEDQKIRIQNIEQISKFQQHEFVEKYSGKYIKSTPFLLKQILQQQIHQLRLLLISNKTQTENIKYQHTQLIQATQGIDLNQCQVNRINRRRGKEERENLKVKIDNVKNKRETYETENVDIKINEQILRGRQYLMKKKQLQFQVREKNNQIDNRKSENNRENKMDDQKKTKQQRESCQKNQVIRIKQNLNMGLKDVEYQETDWKDRSGKSKKRKKEKGKFYIKKQLNYPCFIFTVSYLFVLGIIAYNYTKLKIWVLVNL